MRPAPQRAPSAQVEERVAQRQKQQRPAAGKHHEGGRPKILVERNQQRPRATQGQHREPHEDQEAQPALAQPDARTHPDEGAGDRRQGARQPFRIVPEPAVRIEAVGMRAQHPGIDAAGEIHQRLVTAGRKQHPVAKQEADDDRPLHAPIQPQRHKRRCRVADPDALQDAPGPERGSVVGPHRHRMQRQAQQHQPQRAQSDLRRRRAGPQTQRDGNPHNEKEGGKDQVGRREAVPAGMLERRIDVLPAARVVDQQHRGDGPAAQHVHGRKARSHRQIRRLCHHPSAAGPNRRQRRIARRRATHSGSTRIKAARIRIRRQTRHPGWPARRVRPPAARR